MPRGLGEKGDCPPPHLKYKLTMWFLMQSGAQIVIKHVLLVYLQCPMLSLCVCATQWHTNTMQTQSYDHVGHVSGGLDTQMGAKMYEWGLERVSRGVGTQ